MAKKKNMKKGKKIKTTNKKTRIEKKKRTEKKIGRKKEFKTQKLVISVIGSVIVFLIVFLILMKMNFFSEAFLNNNFNTQVVSPMVKDCEKNNGEYKIITAEDGSQSGVCVLPNGMNCSSEQYYKGLGCFEEQLNWYTCDEFKDAKNCDSEINIVCARAVKPNEVIWLDFTNPCIACTSSSSLMNITHYVEGDCSSRKNFQ